jgi:hypothetical protein
MESTRSIAKRTLARNGTAITLHGLEGYSPLLALVHATYPLHSHQNQTRLTSISYAFRCKIPCTNQLPIHDLTRLHHADDDLLLSCRMHSSCFPMRKWRSLRLDRESSQIHTYAFLLPQKTSMLVLPTYQYQEEFRNREPVASVSCIRKIRIRAERRASSSFDKVRWLY